MSDFPPALRNLTVALVIIAITLAALSVRGHAWPSWWAVLVLGALAMLSEHQRVALPGGLAVSAGLMVGMTAIVVFRAEDAPLGAILVGAVMGIYLHQLRKGRRGWIAFNAANCAIGYAGAVAVMWMIPTSFSERMPVGVLAAVPVALVAVALEGSVLALSFWVE